MLRKKKIVLSENKMTSSSLGNKINLKVCDLDLRDIKESFQIYEYLSILPKKLHFLKICMNCETSM